MPRLYLIMAHIIHSFNCVFDFFSPSILFQRPKEGSIQKIQLYVQISLYLKTDRLNLEEQKLMYWMKIM